MDKQEWAVVKSGAGNIHLMPYENMWANDEVIHALPGEMTKEEAMDLFKDWLTDDPKVKAYMRLQWDTTVTQINNQ